ncbi:acetoacetate decarboxylase family protein [Nocardioides ochotonae]|uniref:acetoacetate decarboxylase family protein n=1 Tax=Nocardioides ochotonae TaxID=2685869 RepID=UPI00140E3A71|nr:acetoacetate decarboxylase family protein [Nocardioides ochotonae]
MTTYPDAPWDMVGQLWLTLFRVPAPVDDLRPAGVHGVAFVRYEEGSPLTYSELLVARQVANAQGRRVSISDIWVDSAASVAGGRELWAIPKLLAELSSSTVRRGPISHTEWSAVTGHQPIVQARFGDVSGLALRTPFRGGTWQPGIPDTDGEERTAQLTGSAKALPCRAQWDFATDGPLGWLAGARQLASFRMTDFRMSFA